MSASQFERDFLDAHNEYRRLHNAPPLRLSRKLCDFATAWAKKIAASNTLQHNPKTPYGENIYWASGMPVDGRTPVKSWYDEVKNYNYARATFGSNTGHFTQVVWKGSQEVGVGVAKNGSATFVVACYDPPGNMMNRFAENVERKS